MSILFNNIYNNESGLTLLSLSPIIQYQDPETYEWITRTPTPNIHYSEGYIAPDFREENEEIIYQVANEEPEEGLFTYGGRIRFVLTSNKPCIWHFCLHGSQEGENNLFTTSERIYPTDSIDDIGDWLYFDAGNHTLEIIMTCGNEIKHYYSDVCVQKADPVIEIEVQ